MTSGQEESWIPRLLSGLGDQLARRTDPRHVYLAVSGLFHGIDAIPEAYQDAKRLFYHHTLARASQLLLPESVADPASSHSWEDPREKARCLLKLSKLPELRAMFAEVLRSSEAGALTVLHVRQFFEAAFAALAECADGPMDSGGFRALCDGLDACVTSADFELAADRMIGLLGEADPVRGPTSDQTRSGNPGEMVVEKVCRIIDQNYANSDISLRSLADRYRMSPAYLSRLFLERRKVRYSDFLFDVRMQNARATLVREDVRIKDLCAMVGYRNPNVFIKAFRKRFGVSPGEFKRLYPSS